MNFIIGYLIPFIVVFFGCPESNFWVFGFFLTIQKNLKNQKKNGMNVLIFHMRSFRNCGMNVTPI